MSGPLISYAQNFEDVMLWRALRDTTNGFYVDIGAHDPRIDSVSRLFYEHGWRGIHVEPLPVYCNALREDRPDETVIQAAVAEKTGILRFFEIPDTGISTANPEIAQAHRDRGFHINEIVVPSITLAQVFAQAQGKPIHWLKIDVEGLEDQVLAGWGEAPDRPWLIVVESTLPLTQQESYEQWEHHLTARDYQFVYFDGLNRFYLANGQNDLRPAFNAGPNVFDGFSFSGQASATFCHVVQQRLQSEHSQNILQLVNQAETLRHQIEQLQHSALESDQQTKLREADLKQAKDALLKSQLSHQEDKESQAQREHAHQSLLMQARQASHEDARLALERVAQRDEHFATALQQLQETAQAALQQHVQSQATLQQQLELARSEQQRLEREQFALSVDLAQKHQQATEALVHQHAQQIGAANQRERELATQLLQQQQQAQQASETRAKATQELERAHAQSLAQQEKALQQQLELARTEQQRLERKQLALSADLAQKHQQATEALVQQHAQQIGAANQRERELAAQLLQQQQKALQASETHAKATQELERAHAQSLAQQEKALQQQLELARTEQQRLERTQLALSADLAQKHHKATEALVQQHAQQIEAANQRERELAAQLLQQQQKAQQASETRAKATQEFEHSFAKTLAQREQEFTLQLLGTQEQAAKLAAEQARHHAAKECTIHDENAQQQKLLAQQLQTEQLTIRQLQQDLAHRESAARQQVHELQRQMQALNHAQQLQAQQHNFELSAQQGEHKRFIESADAIQARLQAEMLAEQRTALKLSKALAGVQQALAETHASLSWRLTAPLRTLFSFFGPNRTVSPATAAATSIIAHPVSSPPSIHIQGTSTEPIMSPSFATSQNMSIATASTLDELLAYHDQSFVVCAYQTLLGRAPDPEGLGYYLARLRAGIPKIQLLAQLRRSKEGQALETKLGGLDVAILRHRQGQIPLIGWVFRWFKGLEGNSPAERKLRGIEHQIVTLSVESSRRFDQLETALAGLHHLVAQQTQSVATALGRTSWETSEAADIAAVPDGLKHLSPKARDIYFQLKTAASRHAMRAA